MAFAGAITDPVEALAPLRAGLGPPPRGDRHCDRGGWLPPGVDDILTRHAAARIQAPSDPAVHSDMEVSRTRSVCGNDPYLRVPVSAVPPARPTTLVAALDRLPKVELHCHVEGAIEARNRVNIDRLGPINAGTIAVQILVTALTAVFLVGIFARRADDPREVTSWARAHGAVTVYALEASHRVLDLDRARTERLRTAHPLRPARPGRSTSAASGPGGSTSPGNGGPACGTHNRHKERGFSVRRDEAGHWHTYRPDGTEIT